LNGFQLFNNVTGMVKTVLDEPTDEISGFNDLMKYDFPEVDGNSWTVDENNVDTCRYCFDEYTQSDFITTHVELRGILTNTSTINQYVVKRAKRRSFARPLLPSSSLAQRVVIVPYI